MMKKYKHLSTSFCLILSATLLGCQSLPNTGPNKKTVMSIRNADSPYYGKVEIVDLSNKMDLKKVGQLKKKSSLTTLPKGWGYSGKIGKGDVLSISIWEAPPAILFGNSLSVDGSGSSQVAKLPNQRVSADGKVTVPFVGTIRAAGKTPEQLQRNIVYALEPLGNNPQAIVNVAKSNASSVIVVHNGGLTRVPLEPQADHILDALSAAKVMGKDIKDMSVRVTRGSQHGEISMNELTKNTAENILLRNKDTITVLDNNNSFSVLGAVNRNEEIFFGGAELSLANGLARAAGLMDNRSDAEGVFVYRQVDLTKLPEKSRVRWIMKGYLPGSTVPVIYRFNMRKPNSPFVLKAFPIQDGDIVYVANAPAREFQKFMQMIFSSGTSAVSGYKNLN